MTETLMTIDDLLLANESSLEVSQYYLSQVTVEEDLYAYLRWLYDNGGVRHTPVFGIEEGRVPTQAVLRVHQ
jgi:hypothetical protein